MTAPEGVAARLDELEALHAAATPGPWELDSSRCCVGSRAREGYFIAGERTTATPDAALIVAAVNALPDLIAEIRDRKAQLRVLTAERDELDRQLTSALSGRDDHTEEAGR